MRRSGLLFICLALCTAALVAVGAIGSPHKTLRVCADPNNLPFSNEREEGFENKLANLVAADLGAEVRYTWWAQRRGFVRNTLRAGVCDVIMGVPSDFELARTTRPYYRSTYVFVTRQDSELRISSVNDPRLRTVRIGVHLIGDDYANVPPAHALANRGIIRNVVGYSIYGDYGTPTPPARLIEGVARGDIDIAVAWGPLAAYASRQSPTPLTLTPVETDADHHDPPFVYAISMGVRRDDVKLLRALNRIIDRRASEIDAILNEFGVPRR